MKTALKVVLWGTVGIVLLFTWLAGYKELQWVILGGAVLYFLGTALDEHENRRLAETQRLIDAMERLHDIARENNQMLRAIYERLRNPQ